MGRSCRPLLGILPLVLACAAPAPPPPEAPEAPRLQSPRLLVDADWVANHGGRPTVVVIHVDPDPAAYEAGHLPGAVFLDLDTLRAEPPTPGLPEPKPLARALRRAGASDERITVLYGGEDGLHAAWAFFALDFLGHGDQVALLDGGVEGWVRSGRALVQGPAESAPDAGPFTSTPDPTVIATPPTLAAKPDMVLVDVRPAAAYLGRAGGEGTEARGHIPGARSFHWRRAVVGAGDPTLVAEDVLSRKLAAAGVDPGVPVAVYGQGPLDGAMGYFLARLLGHPTRLYVGGYQSWVQEKRPVAQGDQGP